MPVTPAADAATSQVARLDFFAQSPSLAKLLAELGAALGKSAIEETIRDLVAIRASSSTAAPSASTCT